MTRDGFGGAFADLAAIEIDAGHSSLGGEWDELCLMGGKVAAAQIVLLFGQHDGGAGFWGLRGQRGELAGGGPLGLRSSRSKQKFFCLAVAERNRAGFIEQEGVYVSGCLDGTPRHRENCGPNQAVNAGNADG